MTSPDVDDNNLSEKKGVKGYIHRRVKTEDLGLSSALSRVSGAYPDQLLRSVGDGGPLTCLKCGSLISLNPPNLSFLRTSQYDQTENI